MNSKLFPTMYPIFHKADINDEREKLKTIWRAPVCVRIFFSCGNQKPFENGLACIMEFVMCAHRIRMTNMDFN